MSSGTLIRSVRRSVRPLVLVAGVLLALAAPLSLNGFWLQSGLFAMAAAVSAIGLTLLVGRAGQLSLGHAFFVAVGAYGYCYLAGTSSADGVRGLGLPPLLAAFGAVVAAGTAGALFSPISGRLRGIYLGLASLGLVFLGQHILKNAIPLTGGFNGRDAAPLDLFGFSFSDSDPAGFLVLGVPYGQLERLWYVGLVCAALAWWSARNLLRSRPGRALATVRDSEVAAGAMGIDVVRYKAAAFVLSSMYAGLGGVLTALAFGRIVPDSFGLSASVAFLVMIVIGGIGSVGGAVGGAFFVTLLPLVLDHYSGRLPFLSPPGSEGLDAAGLSEFVYGLAIVLVLLFAHGGLAGFLRRAATALRRTPGRDTDRPSDDERAPLRSHTAKEPAS
ncbi:branched-chain amino acid ABC transporter permease [Streptomyces apricus]